MEGVVFLIIVGLLAAFNLAALRWGVDSRTESADPRAPLRQVGLTAR